MASASRWRTRSIQSETTLQAAAARWTGVRARAGRQAEWGCGGRTRSNVGMTSLLDPVMPAQWPSPGTNVSPPAEAIDRAGRGAARYIRHMSEVLDIAAIAARVG